MVTGSLGGSNRKSSSISGKISSGGVVSSVENSTLSTSGSVSPSSQNTSGKMNNEVKTLVNYDGLTTDTAIVTVDNYDRTIKVDVKGGGGGGVAIDEEFLTYDNNAKATINPIYRSGYLTVENVVKRNQIDRDKLEVGTRCYVKNEDKFYKLSQSSGTSKVWEDDNQTETFDRYASSDKHGTVKIGENLTTDANGKLKVDVATQEEQGSTKPITAGAVYNILGDIKVRLGNI